MITCFVCLTLVALSLSTDRQSAHLSYNRKNQIVPAESEAHNPTVAVISAAPLADSNLITIELSRKRPVRHRRAVRAQEKSLEDILTDQSLWGKDFPSVLRSLPAFGRAGEEQVAVFQDRIVGRTKRTSRRQTEPSVARLARQLSATQNLKARSPRLESYITKGPTGLKAEIFQLSDDRTFRISAVEPSAQFLASGLTIADVQRLLGKEERVTTEVLDDGTDRRPIILTLHHYAGGAIVFVESDVNPNIGSVDRVFLGVSRISASLF
jgi:hypothetical protein